jgi:hypothetical protein
MSEQKELKKSIMINLVPRTTTSGKVVHEGANKDGKFVLITNERGVTLIFEKWEN